jgi:hypothetical protein
LRRGKLDTLQGIVKECTRICNVRTKIYDTCLENVGNSGDSGLDGLEGCSFYRLDFLWFFLISFFVLLDCSRKSVVFSKFLFIAYDVWEQSEKAREE